MPFSRTFARNPIRYDRKIAALMLHTKCPPLAHSTTIIMRNQSCNSHIVEVNANRFTVTRYSTQCVRPVYAANKHLLITMVFYLGRVSDEVGEVRCRRMERERFSHIIWWPLVYSTGRDVPFPNEFAAPFAFLPSQCNAYSLRWSWAAFHIKFKTACHFGSVLCSRYGNGGNSFVWQASKQRAPEGACLHNSDTVRLHVCSCW